MARFTIIILLCCLGILGYLYYGHLNGEKVETQSLKERIQFLEIENEELKAKPPTKVEIPPQVIERPKAPVVVPLPPKKLEIRKGEPLRN